MTLTLSSAETATIPSNYSRIIGRELELQVREIPALLKFTQLTPQQFMQEDTLLTGQQQIQILHNAVGLSKQEDFGLRLGRRLTPATHGAMGFLANSSPNLLVALQAFEAFLPTRISFAHLNVHYEQELISCSLEFDINLSPSIHRVLSETCAVIFYECAEFIVGRPVTEAKVFFGHAEPNYNPQYAQFLSGQYAFNAKQLMVTIPRSICEIANASANSQSYLIAKQQCEIILAQLQSHQQNYTYKIQKMMLSHPYGELNEQDIAAALFISKRTLARHLEKDGTSFRQIRDALLSKQAALYLQDSHLSVDAIASLLNYHDSANFRRAFKRWFNMSPSECRQQHHEE